MKIIVNIFSLVSQDDNRKKLPQLQKRALELNSIFGENFAKQVYNFKNLVASWGVTSIVTFVTICVKN